MPGCEKHRWSLCAPWLGRVDPISPGPPGLNPWPCRLVSPGEGRGPGGLTLCCTVPCPCRRGAGSLGRQAVRLRFAWFPVELTRLHAVFPSVSVSHLSRVCDWRVGFVPAPYIAVLGRRPPGPMKSWPPPPPSSPSVPTDTYPPNATTGLLHLDGAPPARSGGDCQCLLSAEPLTVPAPGPGPSQEPRQRAA